MTTEFFTREYELSHGRKPSGRGGWAFIPVYVHPNVDIPSEIQEDTAVFVPGSMTLTEARKAIKAAFPQVSGWEVAP